MVWQGDAVKGMQRFIRTRGLALVMLLLTSCTGGSHTAIAELLAGCRSPTSSSQTELASTPAGGGGCIAFSSQSNDGDTYISVMVADGSQVTRLTEPFAKNWDPAWSPDGKRIAFTSNRGDGNWDIYGMDADGSNRTQLTDHSAYDQHPAWSPDGTRIAFTSQRDTSDRDPKSHIYVMDVDGSHLIRLTNDPDDDWDPAWSPDGSRIVFAGPRDCRVVAVGVRHCDGEIYVVDADGSHLVRLTDDSIHEGAPAWSPDGTRIAYVVSERADLPSQIYVMNVDGSDPTRLTDCVEGCGEPAWSPDGTRIAYSCFSDGAEGHDDICVMAADGSNPTCLTSDAVGGRYPAWQP